MNSSFGLGIIIDLKDHASAGLKNIHDNFNKLDSVTSNLGAQAKANTATALTAAGFALQNVGDSFMKAGSGILNTYAEIGKKVIGVGTMVTGTRVTLGALFGSAKEGEKAFQWTKDYAEKSIFNFKDLLPAMTMMKAVGIDIRDQVRTSSGESQNLLDYAGDLAAIFPNARNMYGTGVNATMGAMKEYIAEGNMVSLKRGLGLDIEQIIGEKKGSTIKERTRQIADLTKKIGAYGMVTRMAGTPMVMLSNMQDKLFNLMTLISDAGLFKKYTELITIFAEYLKTIPEEELAAIAKIISNAFVSLISPISKVIEVVILAIDWFRRMTKENPSLAETVIKLVAVAGAVLVGFGVVLKFAGSLFMLSGALTMLSAGSVGLTSVLSLLGSGFMGLLPVIAIVGLLFYAWSKNIGGIQDKIKYFFNNTGFVMHQAKLKFSDVMIATESLFETSSAVFGRVFELFGQTVFKAFSLIWDIASEVFPPLFNNLVWFAENLLTLFDAVFPVIAGAVLKAFDQIRKVWDEILKPVFWELMNTFETINVYFEDIIGPIVSAVSNVADTVTSELTNLVNWMIGIFKANPFTESGLFSFIETVIDKLNFLKDIVLSVLPPIFDVVKHFVESVFYLFKEIFPQVVEFVSDAFLRMEDLWINVLKPVFDSLIKAVQYVNNFIASVLPDISGLIKIAFDAIWEAWDNVLRPVFDYIVTALRDFVVPVIGTSLFYMAQLFSRVFKFIRDVYTGVIKPVFRAFGEIIRDQLLPLFRRNFPAIVKVVHDCFKIIKDIWDRVLKPVFSTIIAFIRDTLIPVVLKYFPVVSDVIDVAFRYIKGIWDNVLMPVFEGIIDIIANAIVPFIQRAFPVISRIINKVFETIKVVWDKILKPVFEEIIKIIRDYVKPFIEKAFPVIGDVIGKVLSKIAEVWENILAPAFTAICDFIINILVPAIVEYFPIVRDIVLQVFQGIADFWNNVLKPTFEAIWSVIADLLWPIFSSVFGLIWKIVLIAFDQIRFAWENVLWPVLQVLWTFVRDTLWPNIKYYFGVISDVVGVAFDIIKTAWDEVLQPVFSLIWKFITETLAPIFETVFQDFGNALDTVFKAIQTIWDTILKPVFDAVLNIIDVVLKPVFETVFTNFGSAFDSAAGAIKVAWNDVLKPVFDTIGNVVGFLSQKLEDLNNFLKMVKESIDNFFGAAGELFEGGKLGGLTIDSGISYHAKGAVFNTPTFFNTPSGVRAVGERGPEAVAPIDVLLGYVRQAVSESKQSPIILNNVNKVLPPPVVVNTEKTPERRLSTGPTNSTNNNDYSVNFSQGSVVIQIADATNASLEKAADKLMKIIERKQQLKQMSVRNRG